MRAHIPIVTLVLLLTPVVVPGLTAATVNAEVIHVCWDGSGDYVTIQEGIDAASDGDEVVVCDGTYTGSGNKNLDFHGKAITVRSANGLDNCIIDCENDGRGFYLHNNETPTSVVEGFTITEGSVNDHGGAILCQNGSSPTISNCEIVNNTAYGSVDAFGGGVHLWSGSAPIITDCTIVGNVADDGGGITALDADATIVNCEISANVALDRGGAIYCRGGSLTIANCIVRENTARGHEATVEMISGTALIVAACTIADNAGGGLAGRANTVVISDCAIIGNAMDSGFGAGIACGGNTVRITNCLIWGNSLNDGDGGGGSCGGDDTILAACTIVGNSASYAGGVRLGGGGTMVDCLVAGNVAGTGGGIGCFESHARIVNCTVTANAATGDGFHSSGGGIHCFRRSSPTVTNCIVWGNTADQGAQIALTGASGFYPTLAVNYSDVQGGEEVVFLWGDSVLEWGPGNIDADPLFVDPDGPDDDPNTWEDNDHHLSPGSPCIDAACNWAVPSDTADLDEDGDVEELTPLDLDGEGRFFDDPDTDDTGCGCPAIVDVGAYEFGDTGPQPCPGDLDCDRVVGHSDLGILLGAWHRAADGDLNCDGETDHADLGILLAHWGEGCP